MREAVAALNRHFGIKHMHRPCRAAAGAPFGRRGLRWHAVRLRGGEALRERRCRRLRDEHGDASFVSARRGVA